MISNTILQRLRDFPQAPDTYGMIRANYLVVVPQEIRGDIPKVCEFIEANSSVAKAQGEPVPVKSADDIMAALLAAPPPAPPRRTGYVWEGTVREDVSGRDYWTRTDNHSVSLEIPEEHCGDEESILAYVKRHYRDGIDHTDCGDQDYGDSEEDDRTYYEAEDGNEESLVEQYTENNPE